MTYFNQNRAYINQELYYTIFRHGKRVILAPCEELKKAQKYFKNALNWTYPLEVSTIQMASIHCHKKWILKLDIKDFFGSVPYKLIEKVIQNTCKKIKNADINYYLMITTLDGKLPTGAPTSSHIANACFAPIDEMIKTYCRNLGIRYSRFADDMTFSSDEKYLLNMAENYARRIINMFGFRLNDKKTRYISNNKQQNVLGLVVNNKQVTLPKAYRKKLRAMLHNYSICKLSGAKNVDLKYRAWDEHNIQELKGSLAYTKQVDKNFYNKLKNYAKKLGIGEIIYGNSKA